MKLKADPTKQEEIRHYQKFVENLPQDSYLHMILKDTVYTVERDIRNDFGLPLVSCLEMEALNSTIKRQDEELKELRSKTLLTDYMIKRFKQIETYHIRKFKKIARKFKRDVIWYKQNNDNLIALNNVLKEKYNQVQEIHEFLGQ